MLVAYGKRAIDGTLEVWLPRLVESNDALEQGLRFVRDPGNRRLPARAEAEHGPRRVAPDDQRRSATEQSRHPGAGQATG
jgi:hypothetical protein